MDDREYTIKDIPCWHDDEVKAIVNDESKTNSERGKEIHKLVTRWRAQGTDGIPKPVMPPSCIAYILEKLGY